MDLTSQRLAGRYALRERLASGGMASIWLADDEVLARAVAVKVLHEDLAGDPDFVDRFRQEAVSAARLSHPRILRIYDTGTDGDVTFIVMELFAGADLGALLERGPLEPGRAAWIVSCALEGLGHAHEQGVIHRDVKPANIMVGDDGEVKVTDFGVAKAAAGEDMTTTGTILGTVAYLAPEQVEGGTADARSDLYAMGLVLYEALTGRTPFEADTPLASATMRLTQDPMPPRAVRGGIPRELERVAMKALARDPQDRFASAEDMRRALGRAVGDSTGEIPAAAAPARRPAPPPPAPRRSRATREPSFFRSWMLVPLLLLAVTAIVVALGLAFGRLELGGPLGVRPAPDGGGQGTQLRLVSAEDFDPPPGDGSENPGEVANAIDGDAATRWETERYSTETLGGLKPGVGLIVELGSVRTISEIRLDTPLAGWRLQVRSADAPGEELAAASLRPGADGTQVFTVKAGANRFDLRPFQGRRVLIWITALAPSGGGYRAELADVFIYGDG